MSTEDWTVNDRSEIVGIIESYEQTYATINGWWMIIDGDKDALSAVLANLSLSELNKVLTAAGATPLSVTTPTDGYIIEQSSKSLSFLESSCRITAATAKRLRLVTTHGITK